MNGEKLMIIYYAVTAQKFSYKPWMKSLPVPYKQ